MGDSSFARGLNGWVDEVVSDSEIVINFDDDTSGEVHPNQCRKLKAREKAAPDSTDSDEFYDVVMSWLRSGSPEIYEVRKKKKKE